MALEFIIHDLGWEMLRKISKGPSRNLVTSEFKVNGLMMGDLANQTQKYEVGVEAAA